MSEEKQFENTQKPMADGSEDLGKMANEIPSTEVMSAETETAVDLNVGSESSAQVDQGSEDLGADTQDLPIDTISEADQDDGGIDYQAAVRELTRTIESLKTQLEDRTTQYMRIAADFDNFRKRTQKEKEDLEVQIKCNTVVELLPVVDNFERARSQIKPQTDSEMNIHKSYQGVYKDFVDRLKRIGVAPMRAEGKEFDPNLHEAVMREQTNEHPEGTVVEELVRGYLLGDRVLRHAMVKVAATPEPSPESEENAQENTED
jgi:molecular chaperone GrpE